MDKPQNTAELQGPATGGSSELAAQCHVWKKGKKNLSLFEGTRLEEWFWFIFHNHNVGMCKSPSITLLAKM